MSPRSRARILGNLETIYREAYNRAKEAGDTARMLDHTQGAERAGIPQLRRNHVGTGIAPRAWD